MLYEIGSPFGTSRLNIYRRPSFAGIRGAFRGVIKGLAKKAEHVTSGWRGWEYLCVI